MAVAIQLEPSRTPYRMQTQLGDWNVTFRVRWNARDESWYFDAYDEDQRIILAGARLVLGVNLGRRSPHAFFDDWMLKAIDTSGQGKEATFDDVGRRVHLLAIDPRDPYGGA